MDPSTNRAQAESIREYLMDTVSHFWFRGPYQGLSQERWKDEIRSALPRDKGYTDEDVEKALRAWKQGC